MVGGGRGGGGFDGGGFDGGLLGGGFNDSKSTGPNGVYYPGLGDGTKCNGTNGGGNGAGNFRVMLVS